MLSCGKLIAWPCPSFVKVLRMEHLLLKVLEFDIATPTVNCFCERFLAQINADETTSSLAMVNSCLLLVSVALVASQRCSD